MNKKIKNLFACGLLISMVGGASAHAYEDYGFFHLYSDKEVRNISGEYSEKLESLEKSISKVKNLVNRDKLDNILQEINKNSKSSFFFNRFKYKNLANCIENLNDTERLINKLVEQEKEETRIETERHAKEVKDYQDGCVKNIQSDLIQSLNNAMDQVMICIEDLSDCDAFTSNIKSLSDTKEKLVEEIENFKLKDSDRNEDDKLFQKSLETATMPIKSKTERFVVRANNLLNDIVKVKKDLEMQVVEEARVSMYNQLSEIKRQINDNFNINNFEEFEEKQKETLIKFANELMNIEKGLENETEAMSSLEEKLSVEQKYNLLKIKYNRYLGQKKAVVEAVMKEKAKEKFIEDIHNPRKVIELLREKKIGLKDVVGGTDEAIDKINDLISKHRNCMETNKGVPSKGMILYGNPGTGKTSLVKSMAAYHNLDIVTLMSESDDADIKAKFNEAKTLTHGGKDIVILLIDEIDAVGSQRLKNSESKGTVALLKEIDLVKPGDGIVMIATTNYLEKVDEAVKRSGRLEDKCEISIPNEQGIKEIVSISLLGYRLEDGIDITSFSEDMVSDFRGMTGADIKRIIECTVQNILEKSNSKRLKDIIIRKDDIRETIKQKNG